LSQVDPKNRFAQPTLIVVQPTSWDESKKGPRGASSAKPLQIAKSASAYLEASAMFGRRDAAFVTCARRPFSSNRTLLECGASAKIPSLFNSAIGENGPPDHGCRAF
jgi:hypothetical protein